MQQDAGVAGGDIEAFADLLEGQAAPLPQLEDASLRSGHVTEQGVQAVLQHVARQEIGGVIGTPGDGRVAPATVAAEALLQCIGAGVGIDLTEEALALARAKLHTRLVDDNPREPASRRCVATEAVPRLVGLDPGVLHDLFRLTGAHDRRRHGNEGAMMLPDQRSESVLIAWRCHEALAPTVHIARP